MAAEAGAGGSSVPPQQLEPAAADEGAWAHDRPPGGSTQATSAAQAPAAEGAPTAASGDRTPEGTPPRRKSFAEALYRALIRLAPYQRPQVLAVFRFLKQHPTMAHAQVQPTLVAALGLELVRTAWLKARREVDGEENGGPRQPQEQPALQLEQPPAQARVHIGRRLRAASVDGEEEAEQGAAMGPAMGGLRHEENEVEGEARRVRPRLAARQETVTWRAGEEVPVYLPPSPPQQPYEEQQQPDSGEAHHHHHEPRPDEHHPNCPFYAPAALAGPPLPPMDAAAGEEVNSGGNSDDEEEYDEVALQAAAREEAARDAERERALEEWNAEMEARFQARLAAERAAAAAEANGEELGLEGEPEEGDYDDSLLDEEGYDDDESVPPPLPAVPVALLLAKEEPAVEDEDWLQEGAPDGFICPISYRLLFEPVMAQDGYTYQRSALEKWIGNCQKEGQYPRSPMTNLPMAPWYVPSHTMKSIVGQYIAEKRQQRKQAAQEQKEKEKGPEEGLPPTPTSVVEAAN